VNQANLQKLMPMPLPSVEINDGFWAPKLKINREVTIPILYRRSRDRPPRGVEIELAARPAERAARVLGFGRR